MIVVDTNVIAYLLLPTTSTEAAEQLFQDDPEWAAPLLWRSELRSVLLLYLRKNLIDLPRANALQDEAESLMAGREYDVPSRNVLALAARSGCSAYDCEFVALSVSLDAPLVTADRQLINSFPDIARPL